MAKIKIKKLSKRVMILTLSCDKPPLQVHYIQVDPKDIFPLPAWKTVGGTKKELKLGSTSSKKYAWFLIVQLCKKKGEITKMSILHIHILQNVTFLGVF